MSIELSSLSAFCAAVKQARALDVSAYTLHDGAVRRALVDAAQSGSAVRVRLERDPLDDASGTLHAANADSVAALTAAGADAAETAAGEPVLHMKAAVVDGVAWLDDRNWTGGKRETVLRDTDADDVAALADALRGGGGGGAASAHLRTTKAGAEDLEAGLIRVAGAAPLGIESEAFGTGTIYFSLLERARAGLPTRLLVARREAAEPGAGGEAERGRLAKLAALGVEVRTSPSASADFDEKLAVAGDSGWIGSANATFARGPAGEQRDWGLATRDAPLVEGLRAAFEANWSSAVVFDGSARER